MKINFEQAESIMNFIVKAEELFGAERPLSYEYMTYKLEESNVNDVLNYITKQMRARPEVYERALRDLKPVVPAEKIEAAKVKYANFEQYYEARKKEEGFNL